MDFEIHYTDQQQQFREALRAWLENNAPKDLEIPHGRQASGQGDPADTEGFPVQAGIQGLAGAVLALGVGRGRDAPGA